MSSGHFSLSQSWRFVGLSGSQRRSGWAPFRLRCMHSIPCSIRLSGPSASPLWANTAFLRPSYDKLKATSAMPPQSSPPRTVCSICRWEFPSSFELRTSYRTQVCCKASPSLATGVRQGNKRVKTLSSQPCTLRTLSDQQTDTRQSLIHVRLGRPRAIDSDPVLCARSTTTESSPRCRMRCWSFVG